MATKGVVFDERACFLHSDRTVSIHFLPQGSVDTFHGGEGAAFRQRVGTDSLSYGML